MLWMKDWLETRWRLAFGFGITLFVTMLGYVLVALQPDAVREPVHPNAFLHIWTIVWLMVSVSLAGTGSQTQPGNLFLFTTSFSGPTQYTLSMPVSRARMLAVRVMTGLAETLAFIATVAVLLWALFPDRMGNPTVVDVIRYVFVVFACTSSIYLFATLVQTIFDETIAITATMLGAPALWLLQFNGLLPASLNFFLPMGVASPLVTHSVPWGVVIASAAAGAVFYGASLKMIRVHEF
jgi:hypothetical protein